MQIYLTEPEIHTELVYDTSLNGQSLSFILSMYNAYFGFTASPFSIAPDPRYLYMTRQHREALAHLVYGLNNDGGCILLTGEVGTGKTTTCRCLLEQIPEKVNVALLLNPKISALELLESICDELKVSYQENDRSIKTLTDRINHFLIERNARNERTVLIIDEAQNLSSEVLEQLRLLTNLETDQRKLLQIILLGQPELLDILAKQEMRQLSQRITARYHLQPLSRNEIKAYINHRLAVAGQNIQIFPETTLKQLYKLSRGIPRLINVICDRALLGCYVENCLQVEPKILKKAAKEVFGELKQQKTKPAGKNAHLLPVSIVAFTILLALILLISNRISLSRSPIYRQHDTAPTVSVNKKHSRPDAKPNKNPNISSDAEKKLTDTAVVNTLVSSSNNTDSPTDLAPASSSSHLKVRPDSDADRKLERFIKQSRVGSKMAAYRQLFQRWQIDYNSKTSISACHLAQQAGLRCLHKQGNLNSLLAHNRPAVLKLIDNTGTGIYVTLVHIKKNIATLRNNISSITVATTTLDRHWLGQYSLLWRPPELYTRPLMPGDQGTMVRWLKHSLAKIFQTDSVSSDNTNVYEGKLIDTVKQFQRRNQLTTDGVVGPLTLIHINTALGMLVPVLQH